MNKVAFAAKWSIITEVVVKIISPITNMILARLLSPELFGIVASVTLVTTFVDVFTDAGFQKYIIQHQFADQEDYDLSVNVAFWTNLGISTLMWVLIFIFQDSLAVFVGCRGYGKAVSVSAIVLVFTAFSSIQMATYKKNFEFRKLSYVRIICKCVPLFITIPLALLGFGYWSLVIGNVAGEIINATLLTLLSKWRPRFRYSVEKLTEMFSFCVWSLCEAVTAWLVANLGILLIGQFYDSYYLGIYKGSVTVVNQILSVVTAVMSSVFLTTLSACQSDEKQYKVTVLGFQRTVALFIVPLGMGMYIFRELVTNILLGGQWGDASALVGVWGAVSCINIVIANMNSYVLLSKGKPKYTFISNAIQCVTIVAVFMLMKNFGFYPMFYAIALVALQLSLTQTLFAKKVFDLREAEKIKNIYVYFVAAFIMGVSGRAIHRLFNSSAMDILGVFACILVYFGILMIKTEERTYIKKLIADFIKS